MHKSSKIGLILGVVLSIIVIGLIVWKTLTPVTGSKSNWDPETASKIETIDICYGVPEWVIAVLPKAQVITGLELEWKQTHCTSNPEPGHIRIKLQTQDFLPEHAGKTITLYENDLIVGADLFFPERVDLSNAPPDGLTLLVAHELGHALGYHHQLLGATNVAAKGHVMSPTLATMGPVFP